MTLAEIATRPEATLDRLALAVASEFRAVDELAALELLDRLAAEVEAAAWRPGPEGEAEALVEVLAQRHGFVGDTDDYDHPDNSYLDVVLERKRGLPLLVSTVYAEVARRAAIGVRALALPGHVVVVHVAASPPLLLDPFAGGRRLDAPEDPTSLPAPSTPQLLTSRMLANLVGSFERRHDLALAIRAARLRLLLPTAAAARPGLEADVKRLEARLN